MNKKLLLFLGFLLFGIITSMAQPWLGYLPKKNAEEYTLLDYQQAFEKYKEIYLTKNGGQNFKGEGEEEGLIPGEAQFRRWEWYWGPRVDYKTGKFPQKTAWEVWQDYKKKNAIKSVGGNWINIGPFNINRDDRGTGRINCAAFDPNDNNHFWVGAPAGGLWETTDGGASWTCLTDENPILGVSDIAIPGNYDKNSNPTIYIATGDRDAKDDPSIGVLKTTEVQLGKLRD